MSSIRERAISIREGRSTAVDEVERCLDALQRRDPEVNAFITVLADDARDRARRADRELARGEDLGVLHGMPLSVKDLIDLRGLPTTAASRVRAGHRAPADAPALAHLRAAGAVFVGKCNLHEFAFGTTGADSAYGPTRNPRALSRMSGGSSSGSAASVAAGMAVGSIGTDTGGSIRIPAAACGVVGLKPAFGEISCEGVVPLAPSLDHVGPLGQTVDDVTVLYRALTGLQVGLESDPRPRVTGSVPTAMRLALLRPYFLDLLGNDVRESFDLAVARLREAGCRIDDASLPDADAVATTYRHTQLYEAFQIHQPTLETHPDQYSTDVRERLELGRDISRAEYERAQQSREVLRREVEDALNGVDALILPTLPITAPEFGVDTVDIEGTEVGLRQVMLRLTQLANLTGHPAVSIPCGLTTDGLPCAVQLVGGQGGTEGLLDVASTCERVL